MIVIDFNQIARIAKLVALLGFFLPWVTVSCSGTEMVNGTGWQLMTGTPEVAGGIAGAGPEMERADWDPSLPLVAAFVVVLLGLILSLTTRAQTAALNLLVCAVLGLGLSYFSMQQMRSQLQHEMSNAQGELGDTYLTPEQREEFGRTVSDAMRFEEQEGYWLTLGALLITALFALLTLMSRRAPPATGPPSG